MAEFNPENWFDDGVATFGDRLEAARQAAGLTVEDLATRLGVRVRTVRSWEANEFEPRANRLQMLAGMLSVSLTWLMTGKGPGVNGEQTSSLSDSALSALRQLADLRAQMQNLSQQMLLAERRLAAEMRVLAA